MVEPIQSSSLHRRCIRYHGYVSDIPLFRIYDSLLCLVLTLLNAVTVIFVFTFYVSVAKEISFKNRFLEMVLISLGIAALTFAIGFVIRIFLNIEV